MEHTSSKTFREHNKHLQELFSLSDYWLNENWSPSLRSGMHANFIELLRSQILCSNGTNKKETNHLWGQRRSETPILYDWSCS